MRALLILLFLSLSFVVSAQSNINIDQSKDKRLVEMKNKKGVEKVLTKGDSLMLKYHKQEIERISNSITHLDTVHKDDIEAVVVAKKKIIDSLSREKEKLESKINPTQKRIKKWLPSVSSNEEERRSTFKSLYNNEFNKTVFVKSFSYLNGNDNDIIQSVLLSDNIGAFLVSFGTVLNIENKKDDNDENAENQNIERLLSAGGNFYLNFELPVYKSSGKIVTYYNHLRLRLASDIEGFGNDIETSDMNASVGMSNYFGLTSDKNVFNLFLQFDSNLYMGTNDFMQNIGVNSDVFFNTNVNLGITMDNKYRLFFRTNFASEPSLRTEKIAVGLQLIK
jgi:hypothetical protein